MNNLKHLDWWPIHFIDNTYDVFQSDFNATELDNIISDSSWNGTYSWAENK